MASSRLLFRGFLNEGWRWEEYMVCLFFISCSLIYTLYLPAGWSQRQKRKNTRVSMIFSLLSSYVKRDKYLQIRSLLLSRATDWSRELTTAAQPWSPCCVPGIVPALGHTERNKMGSLNSRNTYSNQEDRWGSQLLRGSWALKASWIQTGALPLAVWHWAIYWTSLCQCTHLNTDRT